MPGAGKSASLTTLYSTLKGNYVEIAPTSSSQISCKTISQILMNLQRTIYFWDVFGFPDKNYDDVLELALCGQLKDNFKEGDQINLEKQILQPTINDSVHAVVFVVDARNMLSEVYQSLHITYIKKLKIKVSG